jgi:hypothetical protein
MHEQVDIAQWINTLELALLMAAEALVSAEASFTLSDFPTVPFTDNTLNAFVNNTLPQLDLTESDVEDVYSC